MPNGANAGNIILKKCGGAGCKKLKQLLNKAKMGQHLMWLFFLLTRQHYCY